MKRRKGASGSLRDRFVSGRYVALFLVAIAIVSLGGRRLLPVSAGPGDDEQAGRALAREVIAALGGEDHWNDRSWDLGFDFVVSRQGKEVARFSHLWRRSTNECIVSGASPDGKHWRIHFDDVYGKRGTATMDGHPVTDDSTLAEMLDMGNGRFINDSYWLLMPLKLLDSGVHHRRDPDTTIDGVQHKVLAIWFDHVGRTPGDRYWLYVNAATGRPSRWRFLLESNRPGLYLWDDYERVGPMLLPLKKKALDGSSMISFENVRTGHLAMQ